MLTMPGGAARRATATTPYKHIDSLFGDHVIDQGLIEKHRPDLRGRRRPGT
ncbi:hypothetical protein ACGFIJ_36800 [Microbispora bryophytorum]|uniref:hypothetical protein n=1 Tax=Microbispora bryophytorum TaxID=1460882 RepID=UPI0037216254